MRCYEPISQITTAKRASLLPSAHSSSLPSHSREGTAKLSDCPRFGQKQICRTWAVTSHRQTILITGQEGFNYHLSSPLLCSSWSTLSNSKLIWLVSNAYLHQLVSFVLLAHGPFKPYGFPLACPRPLTLVISMFEVCPGLK